jgi:hypothetical protein
MPKGTPPMPSVMTPNSKESKGGGTLGTRLNFGHYETHFLSVAIRPMFRFVPSGYVSLYNSGVLKAGADVMARSFNERKRVLQKLVERK